MKTSPRLFSVQLVLGLLLLAASSRPVQAQLAAITYQGRLDAGSQPVDGLCDFRLTLYDAPTNATAIAGSAITKPAVTVAGGLFTIVLDLPVEVFDGAGRWLEIEVRTNGIDTFTTLAPRQQVTPTPYALVAANVSGVISASSLPTTVVTNGASNVTLSGSFTGNGANVTNVNAVGLAGISSSGFWQTGGNAGTVDGTDFLGTTDNRPFELRVNSYRSLRVEPTVNTPNLIGGSSVNYVLPGVYGATIAGGGTVAYPGGTGLTNRVLAHFATLGGGAGNTASGNQNSGSGDSATVAGGWHNSALGNNAAVGGGAENEVMGDNAVIPGGADNTNSTGYSVIGGGYQNVAQQFSAYSVIGGGRQNTVHSNSPYSVLAGGQGNVVEPYASWAALGGGNGNRVSAGGAASVIAGGLNNTNGGSYSVISGGMNNRVGSSLATIPGGSDNHALGSLSFAAGHRAKAWHHGTFVWADSTESDFISTWSDQFLIRASRGVGIGSRNPQASLHVYSTNNPTVMRLQSSSAPGFGRVEFASNPQGDLNEWQPGYIQSTDNGDFTGGLAFFVNGTGSGNRFGSNEVMRIVNGAVGINTSAPQTTLDVNGDATITGAFSASGSATIGTHLTLGGSVVTGGDALVGGSLGAGTVNPQAPLHLYSAANPTVARIQSSGSPGFGRLEFVSNPQGDANEWRPSYIQSTDNGGFTGGLSFVVNGTGSGNKFGSSEVMRIVNGAVGINTASPQSTLHVIGTVRVQGANNWDVNNTEGDFRIGNDTQRFKIGISTGGNGAGDVWMRAQGGTARLFLKAPGGTAIYSNEGQTTGVTLAAGGGAWTSVSDRNGKENFEPVDTQIVLEKVAALPMNTWKYKSQATGIRHLGPMAQDFKAAFGLGESDTGITTIDADGVALAAIQGLNRKLNEELKRRDAENAELRKELSAIKALLEKVVQATK